MIFRKKYLRAMEYLRKKNGADPDTPDTEQGELETKKRVQAEEIQPEKHDIAAMLLSAFAIFLPVALLVLLVMCLTGFSGSLALLCIPGVVVFACNGMLSVLTTLFLSNSVDYGQRKTGRREESVIFSMQTFVVKAASGVAVFLTGIGLDLIGLAGNTDETGPIAAQSASTLLGLRLMMTVLPMVVLAAALVLFRRKFTLTDARAAAISAELHAKTEKEETYHG